MSIGDFHGDRSSKPTYAFIVVVWIVPKAFDQGACFLVLNWLVGKAFLFTEELLEDSTVLEQLGAVSKERYTWDPSHSRY